MDVLLQVASRRYRCHLGAGCEVSASPPVTRVPGTPQWLTGLMIAREQVIPIVDLARVLGVPAREESPGAEPGELSATRLLTLRQAGLCVGFLVDDVRDGPAATLPVLDLGNVAGALSDRLRVSLGRAMGAG